jgi:large subunit ribosomal protein L4
MPKKMRRQASRCALSSRVADGAVVVVSSLEPAQPKTREMAAALQALQASGKVLLVDERIGEGTSRAARNLPDVDLAPASTLNIVDVLNHDVLVFSLDGIRQVERNLTDGTV